MTLALTSGTVLACDVRDTLLAVCGDARALELGSPPRAGEV